MKYLLALLLTGPLAQALPSDWQFATLRTEHFDIIYRHEQKALAQVYATASEHAYSALIAIFKEAPTRTVVVLKDNTDIANGMATFLPYPLIVIHPILPNVNESISDYGDWAFEIMLHEYTHILNMHPSHGVYTPLRWLFGNVIRPNGLLPRWYLEGLAVEMESYFSEFGRLRSPDSAAALRAMTENGSFAKESIDRINESGIPHWPYGQRPYLLGSAWWHEVARNPEIMQTLNQRYSRRLPFLVNGPLEDHLQKDATEILALAYSHIEKVTNRQLATIAEAGPEKLTPIDSQKSDEKFSEKFSEEFSDFAIPTISPNSLHIVYLANNFGEAATIKLATRTNKTSSFSFKDAVTVTRSQGTTRFAWLPDSSGFVFDQLDTYRPHVLYRDLYLQKLDGETQRLSTGLRASEPNIFFGKVAFIRSNGAKSQLAVMDLNTRKTQILFKAHMQVRLAQPLFHQNGIYFLSRNLDGQDALLNYDFASKQVSPVRTGLKSLYFTAATPQGLLLGSAQTGAANIYLWRGGGSGKSLTNTRTEIKSATWDEGRNELILTRLTATGTKLFTQKIDDTNSPMQPPQLEKIFALADPPPRSTAKVQTEELTYQPLYHLLPTYWIPFIYPVEDGALFQGQTYISDPLSRHSYSLSGSVDTVTNKSGYLIQYTNGSTPVDINMGFAKYQNYLGASSLALENQTGNLGFGFYPTSQNKFWRAQINGKWQQTLAGRTLLRMGPSAGLSYSHLDDPYKNYGFAFAITHQEYLAQSGYIAYGLSSLQMNFKTGSGKTNSQHILLSLKGSVAPELPFAEVVALGETNLGANYLVNLSGSEYLLRGYPSGTFVGRKILNGNLEYQFPLKSIWRGSGTLPLFFKNLEGAAFFDTMAVDGRAFHKDENKAATAYYRSTLKEFYSGTGLEFRLNTTAAYHLPLTITLGLYYGLNDYYGGGFSPFFGIGYQGLGPLDN